MTEADTSVEGGCRCGFVRLRMAGQPLMTSACHCTGCQRMSGSAFSLSVAYPREAFKVLAGETILGGLNRDMHHHCPRCLSWLFSLPPALDWLVNVRSSILDERDWFVPFVETYTAERLYWAQTPAQHSFERLPGADEFASLAEAFAMSGIRPSAHPCR